MKYLESLSIEETASFGVIVGYTGRFTCLFSLVRSTHKRSLLFFFGTITNGWHQSEGVSVIGRMMLFFTIVSNVFFTSSFNLNGICLQVYIALGVAPSFKCIFIGSPFIVGRPSVDENTSENSSSNSALCFIFWLISFATFLQLSGRGKLGEMICKSLHAVQESSNSFLSSQIMTSYSIRFSSARICSRSFPIVLMGSPFAAINLSFSDFFFMSLSLNLSFLINAGPQIDASAPVSDTDFIFVNLLLLRKEHSSKILGVFSPFFHRWKMYTDFHRCTQTLWYCFFFFVFQFLPAHYSPMTRFFAVIAFRFICRIFFNGMNIVATPVAFLFYLFWRVASLPRLRLVLDSVYWDFVAQCCWIFHSGFLASAYFNYSF